uniref:PcfJ domain-containing protein n=1 Tax=Clostridium sp. D53t1_180928_C8 TaxID=2787101 RepID=UPI0018AAD635
LFFIRRIGEEEKPFFAVEINKDFKVVQVRGKRNCLSTKEVKEFMEVFEKEKLNNKKKKSKVA